MLCTKSTNIQSRPAKALLDDRSGRFMLTSSFVQKSGDHMLRCYEIAIDQSKIDPVVICSGVQGNSLNNYSNDLGRWQAQALLVYCWQELPRQDAIRYWALSSASSLASSRSFYAGFRALMKRIGTAKRGKLRLEARTVSNVRRSTSYGQQWNHWHLVNISRVFSQQ